MPFFDPDLLRRAVVELDRRGFQAHFHAIGDAAVRLALDVVQAAVGPMAPSDHRHHIAHIEVIHPDDIARFGDWASSPTCSRSGRRTTIRCGRCAFRSLAPIALAGSSRSRACFAAVPGWRAAATGRSARPIRCSRSRSRSIASRRTLGTSRRFFPTSASTLDAALRAFTIGSAYVNHLDAETGTIEVGKLADLVVLDREHSRAELPGRSATRRCARPSSRARRSSAPETRGRVAAIVRSAHGVDPAVSCGG